MAAFLHADMDAFFASVEQLDNPSLKGKPVIVGGNPNQPRTVVSTCSYEARKFGVHAAMPLKQAQQLCPQGIFIQGRMKRYQEKSKEIMSIFQNYSPDVQQMSIDEAFIDLTGTERLFGKPEDTAIKIKQHVKKETGLTISIGCASNKYVAKIASGYSKPDGFTFIPEGKEQDFMLSLPIEKIWGAGEKTIKKLKQAGFFTTKDIYNASLQLLTSLFGTAGGFFLYNAVRGNAAETFEAKTKSHSISSECTFPYDLTDTYIIETEILQLCQDVLYRTISDEYYSKTACIKIRYGDFTTHTVQKTFSTHFTNTMQLFEEVKTLFYSKYTASKGIRLLGVSLQNCEKDMPIQETLFNFGNEKEQLLEKKIIEINRKKPGAKIMRARFLEKNNTNN